MGNTAQVQEILKVRRSMRQKPGSIPWNDDKLSSESSIELYDTCHLGANNNVIQNYTHSHLEITVPGNLGSTTLLRLGQLIFS